MMQRMSEGDGTVDMPSKVRAWDLPTRLFHWLLALLVLLAWASWRYSEALGDPSLKLHRWNGHAILVLVVWRVLWGLFGSSTSRFSAWLWWPWTAAAYGWEILRGRTPLYLTHNPLGSYMILALLAAVTAQAVLGPLHRRAQRPHRRPALPPDLRGDAEGRHRLAHLVLLLGESWRWCRSISWPISGTASPRRSR